MEYEVYERILVAMPMSHILVMVVAAKHNCRHLSKLTELCTLRRLNLIICKFYPKYEITKQNIKGTPCPFQ